MESQHDILVNLVNKVVGEKELVKESKLLSQVSVEGEKVTQVYEKQTASQRKRTSVTVKGNEASGYQTKVQEEIIRQGPRFQMQYLGIMFAGMALNRTMSNLTQTSKDWLGIGELMSTTMGLVMLPASMNLLEYGVVPLMEGLTSLPIPAQEAIGGLVFGLEGLGSVMMVGGQLMLGWFAFTNTFPGLADKIGGISGALKGLAGIGLVGIAITLGIGSIRSEGGESILYALGAGLAAAFGGILLGASVSAGIAIGAVTVGVLLNINASINRVKYQKDLANRVSGHEWGTATANEELYGGLSPTGGQGTSVGLLSQIAIPKNVQNQKYNIDSSVMNSMNLSSSPTDLAGNPVNLTVSPSYSISVMDYGELDNLLKKNNQNLADEVNRRVTVG